MKAWLYLSECNDKVILFLFPFILCNIEIALFLEISKKQCFKFYAKYGVKPILVLSSIILPLNLGSSRTDAQTVLIPYLFSLSHFCRTTRDGIYVSKTVFLFMN